MAPSWAGCAVSNRGPRGSCIRYLCKVQVRGIILLLKSKRKKRCIPLFHCPSTHNLKHGGLKLQSWFPCSARGLSGICGMGLGLSCGGRVPCRPGVAAGSQQRPMEYWPAGLPSRPPAVAASRHSGCFLSDSVSIREAVSPVGPGSRLLCPIHWESRWHHSPSWWGVRLHS